MDLQQLRALVFVAEAGSVTEGARRLLLTQPAVTRQIRALEEELGGTLFDRTTKPIIPTPLGKTALERARRILQMSEEFRAAVSADAGSLKGELRVGVSNALARRVILPIALELRQEYPGVHLRLTSGWSGSLSQGVGEGLLDAAVMLAPPHHRMPAGLAATRIASEPAVAIASRKTALRGTLPLEALRGFGWVLSPEGCGYRARLKRSFEEAGIPFRVLVEAPDLDLQVQLIRAGVGPGIMPKRVLPGRWEAAGLRAFRIRNLTFSLDVWVAHRRSGPILPVAMPIIEKAVSRVLTRESRGTRSQRAAR